MKMKMNWTECRLQLKNLSCGRGRTAPDAQQLADGDSEASRSADLLGDIVAIHFSLIRLISRSSVAFSVKGGNDVTV